jgi:hypothetical protein
MKQELLKGCLGMLLALGCSGKLQVDRKNPGSGGSVGHLASGGEAGADDAGGAGPGTEDGPCVPGAVTVEASGSAAEAEVQTLDRCDQGLTCGPDQLCVRPPDCAPSTGPDCVVYGAGGAGGAGGLGTGGSSVGGHGNVVDRGRIVALAADDSRLYFVDYGTRDQLGNYQGDGALLAFAFEDSSTTTIASGLQGPTELGVTSSHAYFSVDGGGLVGTPAQAQLFRVPLEGGEPEVVPGVYPRDGSNYLSSFVSAGELAIWTGPTVIAGSPTSEAVTYAMSADAEATPSVLLEPGGWSMATDGTSVFYTDWADYTSISRVSVHGGLRESLVSPFLPFGVNGDSLYGLEDVDNATGNVLVRAPKSGGPWERVRALGAGGGGTKFQLVGDRYFFSQHPPQQGAYVQQDGLRIAVVTAVLGSDDPPVRLLERPTLGYQADELWVGTAETFFWTDGQRLYARSVEP